MSDGIGFADEVRAFIESPEGALLRSDVVSWAKWRRVPHETPDDVAAAFASIFARFPEFRSLVDYRLRSAGVFQDAFLQPNLRRRTELHIFTPTIGEGFRIQHGHSTWVMAESIGCGFHVNQNVTIGEWKGARPTIGNNVSIYSGAVVVGGARIGDRVAIGGNVFVNFDVEDDSIVIQGPPTIKKRKPQPTG